jgi:hypothetical protein
MLLGRPFDVLTKMSTQSFEDGRMDITLTCPNTRKKITMGTYERGKGIKPEPYKEGKLVDMSQPDGPPSEQDREQHEAVNNSSQSSFQ